MRHWVSLFGFPQPLFHCIDLYFLADLLLDISELWCFDSSFVIYQCRFFSFLSFSFLFFFLFFGRQWIWVKMAFNLLYFEDKSAVSSGVEHVVGLVFGLFRSQ